MMHINDFIENRNLIKVNNYTEACSLKNNQNIIMFTQEFILDSNDLILTKNNYYYYYDYFIPETIDKIDSIQIKNINYAEILINDSFSNQIDNNDFDNLEIILFATHNLITIRLFFEITNLPTIFSIKYNSYLFPNELKRQIKMIPFQTDTHIYNDGKIEVL